MPTSRMQTREVAILGMRTPVSIVEVVVAIRPAAKLASASSLTNA